MPHRAASIPSRLRPTAAVNKEGASLSWVRLNPVERRHAPPLPPLVAIFAKDAARPRDGLLRLVGLAGKDRASEEGGQGEASFGRISSVVRRELRLSAALLEKVDGRRTALPEVAAMKLLFRETKFGLWIISK
jgi:hypothetical protein